MNQLNAILLNIFVLFLYLLPCIVHPYTISKTLHIPHLKKNLTERLNSQQVTKNSHTPETITSTINLKKINTKEPNSNTEKKVQMKNFSIKKTNKNLKNTTDSKKNLTEIFKTKQINEIIQKNTIETIDEFETKDENNQNSYLEMKQSINPIFKETPFLNDFQDFLKIQIEKMNNEKVNYDSFYFDQNFTHNHYKVNKCNLSTCPVTKGFCSIIQKNKCICNTNTLNFFPSDPKNLNMYRKFKKDLCGYQQKRMIYAMLFEILIPFGLGHLYADRYLFALIKFVSFFMIPLFIMLIFGIDIAENIKKTLKKLQKDFNYDKIEQEEQKFRFIENLKICIITIQFGSFFLSFMIDAFFFGLGIYKDGYGFDLV